MGDFSGAEHEPHWSEDGDRADSGVAADGAQISPDTSLDDTPSQRSHSRQGSVYSVRSSQTGKNSPSSIHPAGRFAFDTRLHSRWPSVSSFRSASPSPQRDSSGTRLASLSSDLDGAREERSAPWDVIRWMKLKRLSSQVHSEAGRRQFGAPTCLVASAAIVLGTSKGIVLVFDYHQNLKSVIGQGTKAVECGGVASLAISADHTTIASGHEGGHVFVWELSRPAIPFLHIPPVPRNSSQHQPHGHELDAKVIHLAFLGTRRTALVSANEKGMAFTHDASRGLVGRSVHTERVLGRYANDPRGRGKRATTLFAMSPLPLGNAPQASDGMNLVALLTPNVILIVSAFPFPQTQYKFSRPNSITAHLPKGGCLAWRPAMIIKNDKSGATESTPKLAFCWTNELYILVTRSRHPPRDSNQPPELEFELAKKWTGDETLVAVQWINRQVLALLTISQRLLIIDETAACLSDTFDLLGKQILHRNVFASELQNAEDGDGTSSNFAVTDLYSNSLRVFKGRIFVLGTSDLSVGTLSNWADRLLALVEHGSYIEAIRLAASFFMGSSEKATLGLPQDDRERHLVVQDKLSDIIKASLDYAFRNHDHSNDAAPEALPELTDTVVDSCIQVENTELLFSQVYEKYARVHAQGIFFDKIERYILDRTVRALPPLVVKDLIEHYVRLDLHDRVNDIICHMDPFTLDIDQVISICKKRSLYDALVFVWTCALQDYITPMAEFLSLISTQNGARNGSIDGNQVWYSDAAEKMFPFISYTLTGRVYPIGEPMSEAMAFEAKAMLYSFIFSGRLMPWPTPASAPVDADGFNSDTFPYLRLILSYDAPNFFLAMDEAFEDPFLNNDSSINGGKMSHRSSQHMSRQFIVSTLLDVFTIHSDDEEVQYFYMFFARNLARYPQFLDVADATLQRVLVGLCENTSSDVRDECELSTEYLLSIYRPPDLQDLIPMYVNAGFYRVLQQIYRSERMYDKYVEALLLGEQHLERTFASINDLFNGKRLSEHARKEVELVLLEHVAELVKLDVHETAQVVVRWMPTSHMKVVESLHGQDLLEYLREYLAVAEEDEPRVDESLKESRDTYIGLLCAYRLDAVFEYVRSTSADRLHVDRVMATLEQAGCIDGQIVLLSKADRSMDAMKLLEVHLRTLAKKLTSSTALQPLQPLQQMERFVGFGVEICTTAVHQTVKSTKNKRELGEAEELWTHLVCAVVELSRESAPDMQDPYRRLVQQTFTSLLDVTTSFDGNRRRVSFVRIFQSFLARIYASSQTITGLRSVLSDIFRTYVYEEQILSLANGLFDKDLLTHVNAAIARRKRGWRPHGSVCEACGRRVWGPGASGDIYGKWEQRRQRTYLKQTGLQKADAARIGGLDKGKSIASRDGDNDGSENFGSIKEQDSSLVVFGCRHVYHLFCLERVLQLEQGPLHCLICSDVARLTMEEHTNERMVAHE